MFGTVARDRRHQLPELELWRINNWKGRLLDLPSLRAGRRVLVALWLGCCVVGCATTPTAPPVTAEGMPETTRGVILAPGDVLEIKFVYWPDLDVTQSVRADGKISLPLVGEIDAGGLEPAKLHQQILTLYRDKLQEPEITVVVRTEENRHVYVAGEVYDPGPVPLVGDLTAFEAVMAAGGFNKSSAKLANVLIVRRFEGRQLARTLDLRKAIKQADAEPFFLAPNDIVFVPRTKIDRADQWVDQYINRIIPRNIYLGYDDLKDLFGEGDDDSGLGRDDVIRLLPEPGSLPPAGGIRP